MGERKVVNKYYPPDFDPSKVPRIRNKGGDKQIKVRMMLPFSLRCTTCGNFIYKGTKFNSRKEDVQGETYLGIRIYRFYFRCTRCAAEITMKTDPKNSDYVCELGATRNFDVHRENRRQEENIAKRKKEEEDEDAMRALENRTLNSKREMEMLSALDDMKSLNARNARVSTGDAIAALRSGGTAQSHADALRMEAEEDEAAVRQFAARTAVVRLADPSEARQGEAEARGQGDAEARETSPPAAPPPKRPRVPPKVAFAVRRAKAPVPVAESPPVAPKPPQAASDPEPASGLAGLMAYASSDSEG